MDKVLLVNTKAIKAESVIEKNVDEKILSKTIMNVQETQLKQILGKDLYISVCNEAISKANDSGYTIPEPTNELLNDYIKPFLINAVVAEFILVNSYQITNKGVQKLNDNSSTSIQSGELEYYKNYYDNYVSIYKNNLIKFLKENNLNVRGTDTNITMPTIGWYLESDNSCTSYSSSSSSSGGSGLETDPVWESEKDNYYDKPEIDALLEGLGGGGSTPSLQEVTDIGNSTTQSIYSIPIVGGIGAIGVFGNPTGDNRTIQMVSSDSEDSPKLIIGNRNNGVAIIKADNSLNLDTFQLPEIAGGTKTFAMMEDVFSLFEEGTYLPTVSDYVNMTSIGTLYAPNYTRVLNTVTVWGKFNFGVTAANQWTRFKMSVPFITNTFTLDSMAGGAGARSVNGEAVGIRASTGTQLVDFSFYALQTTSTVMPFSFTYRIV